MGAALAVKTLEDILRRYEPKELTPPYLKELPRTITRLWSQEVELHREEHTATDDERGRVRGAGLDLNSAFEGDSHSVVRPEAYGTTLVAAIAATDSLILLQIGDGDILLVNSDSNVRDVRLTERVLGTETCSLSMANASLEFRMQFMPFELQPPSFVMVSSDGYANSYGEDIDFYKVASDLNSMLQAGRSEDVERELEKWLADTSSGGSGDDISAAILWRHLDVPHEVPSLEPGTER